MKKFKKTLACLLAFSILLGLTIPFAGANEPVEIVFVNPLAEIEPINNVPAASRAPFRAKLESGEPVTLLVLYYAKAANVPINTAMADLVRDRLWDIYGDNFRANGITEKVDAITVSLAAGGGTLQMTNNDGTVAISPNYWINQGPYRDAQGRLEGEPGFDPNTAWPESRIPTLGTPWGPKTGFGYTGFPNYEQNFERYAQWASADAVVYGFAD